MHHDAPQPVAQPLPRRPTRHARRSSTAARSAAAILSVAIFRGARSSRLYRSPPATIACASCRACSIIATSASAPAILAAYSARRASALARRALAASSCSRIAAIFLSSPPAIAPGNLLPHDDGQKCGHREAQPTCLGPRRSRRPSVRRVRHARQQRGLQRPREEPSYPWSTSFTAARAASAGTVRPATRAAISAAASAATVSISAECTIARGCNAGFSFSHADFGFGA